MANHTIFIAKKPSRIGCVHSRNIGWVSDQFRNAHGSAFMGLLDVNTQLEYRERKWTEIATALAGFVEV